MQPKYFGVQYDDAGNFTKFKDEADIKAQGWLDTVDQGDGDVFRVEINSSGEALVRKMLVNEEEVEGETDGNEPGSVELVIADWELVV